MNWKQLKEIGSISLICHTPKKEDLNRGRVIAFLFHIIVYAENFMYNYAANNSTYIVLLRSE